MVQVIHRNSSQNSNNCPKLHSNHCNSRNNNCLCHRHSCNYQSNRNRTQVGISKSLKHRASKSISPNSIGMCSCWVNGNRWTWNKRSIARSILRHLRKRWQSRCNLQLPWRICMTSKCIMEILSLLMYSSMETLMWLSQILRKTLKVMLQANYCKEQILKSSSKINNRNNHLRYRRSIKLQNCWKAE